MKKYNFLLTFPLAYFMKSNYLALFILTMLLNSTLAQKVFIKNVDFISIKSNYLFIYKTEITNKQYVEFLNWTKKNKDLTEYWRMFPDTTVWRQKLSFNEPFVFYYLQHQAYTDYPVVGVSYAQAQAFCQWQAMRIMETETFKKSGYDKINVRLPSEKEWMMAARGGLSETAMYPWEGNTIHMQNGRGSDQGKYRLNIKGDVYSYSINPSNAGAAFITTPAESYWPNNWGIYNICGNVAEWVEGQKAKGGSWNSLAYNARIDADAETPEDKISSACIGFRPVLEVVSFKNLKAKKDIFIDASYLQKQVLYVKDSLYAGITETTNKLFNSFLKASKNLEDQIHYNEWENYTRYPYFMQYGKSATFDEYPVVNISFEAAQHFCEWLSLQYNQSKEKLYKKVIFKLPSAKEWEWAAMGGKKEAYFPWGGPYFKNSRGCYLANFSPLEEQYFYKDNSGHQYYNYPYKDSTISRDADGVEFVAPCYSYFPNDYGLFQCTGNVAEMINEKGICKGGSWNSTQNFITIKSNETYKGRDANLGFRFFMQVIEK